MNFHDFLDQLKDVLLNKYKINVTDLDNTEEMISIIAELETDYGDE